MKNLDTTVQYVHTVLRSTCIGQAGRLGFTSSLRRVFVNLQAFKALWTNERLLNIVEQLIGPNIAGHPVWNLRTKTPQNEATTVPWHQGKQT